MKRRVNNLASTTTTKKRRDWKEAEEEDVGDARGGPLPDSDEEAKTEAKPEVKTAAKATTGLPNPVVWFDVSVADKPRGRLHFELFRDLVPVASENFRKLCAGHANDSGEKVSYANTFLDLVHTKTFATGGDIDASLQLEAIEQSGPLRHAKAGLLTMASGNVSSFDPRFQITLGAVPNLDGKQVVFGQLLASPGAALHPLHWIEAVSTSTGTPREEVQIEACGECTTEECQVLLGAMVMAARWTEPPRAKQIATAGQATRTVNWKMLSQTRTCPKFWNSPRTCWGISSGPASALCLTVSAIEKRASSKSS